MPRCEACERARAAGNADAICDKCRWLVVRTRVVTVGAARTFQDDNAEQIAVLGELAAMVGEDAPGVIGRMLRGVILENTTAYQNELNRLTAKYIARLESAR